MDADKELVEDDAEREDAAPSVDRLRRLDRLRAQVGRGVDDAGPGHRRLPSGRSSALAWPRGTLSDGWPVAKDLRRRERRASRRVR
jgi:hypothetical protein